MRRRQLEFVLVELTALHDLQAVELALAAADRIGGAPRGAVDDRPSARLGWMERRGATDSAFASALAVSILLRANADADRVERGLVRLANLQQADGGWGSQPILRIPLPPDRDPNQEGPWRPVRFGPGIDVPDQHRTFTTAACVAALALARSAGW